MKVTFSELGQNTKAMTYIKKYGRLNGWYLANKMNLPTQQECFIITDMQDIESCYQDIYKAEMLYCRADAPWGKGNKLLRSRDLLPEEIERFYITSREVCEEAILLVYIHPSVWITGKYIPRFMTTGAAQVLFRKDKKVIIEIVGQGFDCGDISRGKTLHFKLEVSKEAVLFDLSKILKESQLLNGTYEITQNNYDISRKNRIEELVECYGKAYEMKIDKNIPLKVKNFNALVRIVFEKCIYPVLDSENIWNDYVIMINMYENQPYIYEIWQPKRSSIN